MNEVPVQTVMTVLGPFPAGRFGITDAHSHLWIDHVAGTEPGLPVLDDRAGILSELIEFRSLGGGAVIDCQPDGCGRNTAALADLSRTSRIAVVAATGFHRRRYYAAQDPRWGWDAQTWKDVCLQELNEGTEETLASDRPIQAGFVKAACEVSLDATPHAALEGALAAAAETGSAFLVHTEQGQAIEEILPFCIRHGIAGNRLIFCHVDKRPDFGLHREMAQAGVLLEYDTFYRPKYDPDRNLWPLIEKMVNAGLEGSVALATDMGDTSLWRFVSGPQTPGLPGFLETIQPGLRRRSISENAIQNMMGANIAARLAK